MSRNGIRFALLAALAACGVFPCVLPVNSFAVITGSPHDFSDTGPYDTPATRANIAVSGTCSSCHIPHGADVFSLWVRDLSGYRSNLVNDGNPSSEPNYVLSPTIACYDCHDYHGGGGINDLPNLTDFDSNHRPQDIAFGFTKNGTGNMTEDAPGGSVSGFYENKPPAGSSTYGADPNLNPSDNTQLALTGGHYFKYKDPTITSGDTFDIGDKIPCRDCHDPHTWSSTPTWQAFIRQNWPGGSPASTRLSSWTGQASTYMANSPPTGGGSRSDVNSRTLCIACHGNSDTLAPVNLSDISSAYSNPSLIVRPPGTVSEHESFSQAACVSCHNHNSIDANCSQCHGFPPNPYPPDRRATPTGGTPLPQVTYTSGRDPHPQHVGRADGQTPGAYSIYGFDCKVCHATSALGSRTTNVHQDNTINIAYDVSSLGIANPPDVSSPGTLTCSNVYCHSNGGSDNTAAVTGGYFTPAQWGVTPAPLRCNGCHGASKSGLTQTPDNTIQTGMPNYPSGAAGSATGNSHSIHVVNNGYSCPVCHAQTAQDPYTSGRTVIGSPLRHINGIREVVFDGITATGSYNVDNTVQANNKRCDVSCHGTGKPLAQRPQWGGTLTNGCFDCHSGTEQAYKPQNDYGTAGTPNPVDNNEYLYSGHGRTGSAYPGSGNQPAGFGNYTAAPVDCYLCHSQSAPHTTKSPNDPFRLGSATDGTTGGMGTWTGAWADNTDMLCLGCHGTAAQRSGHDNAASGTTTIDAKTHAEGITGTNYTWPVSPWKCVDCHDPHGDGSSGSERYMMIRSGINAPIDASDTNAGSDGKSRPKRTDANVLPVNFNSLAGYSATAGVYSYANQGNSPPWGPCEVCHIQTTAYSRTLDNAGSHSTRTNRCTTCHPHKAGFAPTACKGCHGPDSVATAAGAPEVGQYWTASGHGRFTTGSPARPIECEDCHDASYLTSGDHKTDGSVSGSPPNNINTEYWPGKSPMNADTNPNRNTAHLKAGYDTPGASFRADVARTFDNYCALTCHSQDYHRHQKNNGPVPQDVMRFGDPDTSTTTNPKQYTWYTLSSYPTDFYRSQSPWVDNDVYARTGMSDSGTAYGVCVSCHDPHGTATTDTKGSGSQATNAMVRGNWKTDSANFCARACHTSRTPP